LLAAFAAWRLLPKRLPIFFGIYWFVIVGRFHKLLCVGFDDTEIDQQLFISEL